MQPNAMISVFASRRLIHGARSRCRWYNGAATAVPSGGAALHRNTPRPLPTLEALSMSLPHPLVNTSGYPGHGSSFPLVLCPDFLSEAEHDSLVRDVDPALRKRRYEKGHWDSVIADFRELQIHRTKFSELSRAAIDRAFGFFPADCKPMNLVHAIDLAATGVILDHVDSVKFSGDVVCGISLLSDSINRLTECESANDGPQSPAADLSVKKPSRPFIDVCLPRRSLYIMFGVSRYNWGHAILGPTAACERQRRISIILRDELEEPLSK